jgi:hypothetical protein
LNQRLLNPLLKPFLLSDRSRNAFLSFCIYLLYAIAFLELPPQRRFSHTRKAATTTQGGAAALDHF